MHSFIMVSVMLISMVSFASQAMALSFDRFLSGFDQSCNFNPVYSDFESSLVERVFSNRQARLPSDLREAFGAARISRKSDHTDVFVPLTGATWRELPLSGLQFYFGNENGINVSVVVFAASASEVRRVFGPTVNASARAMKNDPNNMAESSISFETTNGKPSIACDLST